MFWIGLGILIVSVLALVFLFGGFMPNVRLPFDEGGKIIAIVASVICAVIGIVFIFVGAA